MKDQVKIKLASVSDIEELCKLNTYFYNNTDVNLLRKSLNKNTTEIICIAYVNNMAVGFCSGIIIKSIFYDELRAEMEAMFVREEYRKQGIGNKLLNFLETQLSERGVHHFHVSTHHTNREAILLVEKNAYNKTGEIILDKTKEY